MFIFQIITNFFLPISVKITYVTVGKEAYLLEVPESLRGSVPRDYELRSSKKVSAKGVANEVAVVVSTFVS